MAELSYPINPPDPSPPNNNPSPPSPSDPNPPTPPPETDICKKLQQANEGTIVDCDNVHFGTPKCEIDWVYFNNAPCGFGPKQYQNGIGYAGTFFQAFDQKGFFRIEGFMDADAGQPNLYTYAGGTKAFEVYMYEDGLNVKGLLGGQLGSSESCHVKIYKSDQQTEIDFQGATNLSSEGAEIFKSQLYKQTIEGFVSKYDYNQEWIGLEADVSKSFVWGGLDQSDFFRLMCDNTSPSRAFLEILRDGYSTYAQLQAKDDKINLYCQFQNDNYYFGIEATPQKIEEILYFADTIVKLKGDNSEASTYNSFRPEEYATLVSKNGEDYVYLKGNGDGYSFLENKHGEARIWGSANGGTDYFDINTQGTPYFQFNDNDNRIYIAPSDIPKNSTNDEDNYASFNKLWWITEDKEVKTAAIISSKEIDLRHLGTCWAKYPCLPVDVGPPCIADLTFGGPNNDKCKLTAFDVYVGTGPEFEIYQYNLGLDVKVANNNQIRAAFYTDGSSTFALDVNGTSNSYINAKNSNGSLQAYAHFNATYNGFVLNNSFDTCYMTADGQFRYLILETAYGTIWRTAAGNATADTTVYTADGSKQVYYGVNSSQAAMQFYANNGSNQMFGYADQTVVQWQGTINDAFALMRVDSSEGKFQTSKGSNYTYHFSSAIAADLSLVSNSKATINASAGSANWSATLENGETQAYWQGGGGQIDINTEDANNKYIYLREIDVCIDGEKKKMMILASDPY